MIRLQEQIIKRDNKTYFFGVQLPGFYKEEAAKATPPEEIPQGLIEEKSDDEEKFQRFFLTEEQNLKENHKKKEQTKVFEEGTQDFGENKMKKPNSIEFEAFAEPHYMKPTSVIQKFKFNGFFLFFQF